MRRAEEMRDVDHGLPGQQAQRLRFHLEVLLTARAVHHRDVVACQFAVPAMAAKHTSESQEPMTRIHADVLRAERTGSGR
eukprot:1782895-Rhodomonas_salina.1